MSCWDFLFLRTTHSAVKKIIWMEKTMCHACKKEADFYLYRKEGAVGIVYIPIAKVLQEGYIVCNSCNASRRVPAREARGIYWKQLKKLKNGCFPKEIVMADCNPSEINFSKRVKRLVYSTIWTLLCFPIIVLFPPLLIPIILSIKNFIPAIIKKTAYKSATKSL